MLDSFGAIDSAPAEKAWRSWSEAEAALASAREQLEIAARDREWLEHAVEELRRLSPQPGEEEELAALRSNMQKGARLADDVRRLAARFDDDIDLARWPSFSSLA